MGLALTTAACSHDDAGQDCGNDLIEGTEQCDGNQLGGNSCTTLLGGFTGGALACTDACQYDTSGCTTAQPVCGDGVIDAGEDCDGSQLGGQACADVGNFTGGTLACAGDCAWDVSACEVPLNCGDDIIDAGEDCDGTNLASQTCADVGNYNSGTLACAGDCTWDESACENLLSPSEQLGVVRSVPDATGYAMDVENVLVTYRKPALGNDSAGFVVQADPLGPALFVRVDPATLSPLPAPGDSVSFTVIQVGTDQGRREALTISGWLVHSSANPLAPLVQNVSGATDLVSALDEYEVELVTVDATVVADFTTAGSGHMQADVETDGIVGDSDLRLRLPTTLTASSGLTSGCTLTVTQTPLWRFGGTVQIMAYDPAELTVHGCPAPRVVSATATGDSTVLITMDRPMDGTSITNAAAQLTFTGGLAASAATVNSNEITVSTSVQTAAATYIVTVAGSVTDTFGAGVDPAADSATFLGFGVTAGCGDGNLDAGESCDDGNNEPFDGCAPDCRFEAGHLLISEIVAAPTGGEFIEIYNPTANTIALDDVYLADYSTYYLVTQGSGAPVSSDFRMRFPAGASIAAGSFVVVALEPAANFHTAYGFFPDFDVDPADTGAPAMTGEISANAGLTNTDEMVVLFTWDQVSDLVQDIDYLVYGDTSDAADKTGITVGTGTYANETAGASQDPGAAPAAGQSLHRCDTAEGSETGNGGNGALGHDETSEAFSATFRLTAAPSPGAAPAAGLCTP